VSFYFLKESHTLVFSQKAWQNTSKTFPVEPFRNMSRALDMYYTHNVDSTLFKDGVDVAIAIRTIQYTLEKVGESYMIQRNMGIEPNMDHVFHEVESF
jgi:hypothetical protein